MAVGFIAFLLCAIFVIFVFGLTVTAIVISIIFILKYNATHGTPSLIVSIAGTCISIILVFILVNGIRFFTGGLNLETRTVQFRSANEIHDVENVMQIELLIGSSASKLKLGFFKIYEELYPHFYRMYFNNIPKEVKRIKINFVNLTIHENTQNIMNPLEFRESGDVFFNLINNRDKHAEMYNAFRENREITFNTNYDDEINTFNFSNNLEFDYESIDIITMSYNVDIELQDGRIINVDNIAEYRKQLTQRNSND
jgi:hypothetical protein